MPYNLKKIDEKIRRLKISIITVAYNSGNTIEDTIKSVLSQTYDNYEHIIVDGGSTDNTLEIIKQYEKKYDGKLKYVSEKDNGIYDAMNKGIKMSTGDVIGLLNSDDVYNNNKVLEKISLIILNNKCDGIYGDLTYYDSDLKIPKRKWITGEGRIKSGWMMAHPTMYLKRKIYDKVGLYNTKYKIDADYDFIIRVTKNKIFNLIYIKENLIKMRLGGASSNGLNGYWKNIGEANVVLKDNNYKLSELIILKRIIRTLIQIIKAKLYKSSEKNNKLKNE